MKERLYLEALFGPSSLKESLPVIGVLPVIEEETETVNEDDASEWAADDLEENISDDTRKNTKSNVTFDAHETFSRNHTTESTADVFEGMKENLTENGSKTVPVFNMSEEHLSKCEDCPIESDEKSLDDDKREFNETRIMSLKKDPIMETSGTEAELFVENISNVAETDHVDRQETSINAASEKNSKKGKIESWNDSSEAMLKSDEEVKWDEGILNQTQRNEIMNATDHLSLENGLHGEYYSTLNGVKIELNGQNTSKKKKNKKFNGFRKWCSNLFCCARKKT